LSMQTVKSLLRQHTHLVAFVSHLNRLVVSKELFSFIILTIPFNIYLVTRIIFGIRPQLLVLAVTVIKMSCAFVANRAAIELNTTLHACAKLLPGIQLRVPSGASNKFTLLTFYEQLNCEQSKLGFTAGPLGSITPLSSFKVFISV